ncbi:MAG: hypothetical protein IPH03_17005 [Tetrasphaera sp.]|nr:hypothetical protein [Tetrasphaera sp.]
MPPQAGGLDDDPAGLRHRKTCADPGSIHPHFTPAGTSTADPAHDVPSAVGATE